MEKQALLYEGKAKKVYATQDPQLLIVSYKDDATAFNGLKKGVIQGKGVINNQMSNLLMAELEKRGVPTHLVRELNPQETLVKRVSIVPLEVIVRNLAAGSFSKRYGVEEGLAFAEPVLEFSYKNDGLGDPLLNDDHAVALKLATREELAVIRAYAGGLQAGIRPPGGWDHRAGGRDQPRHLPPVGRPDPGKAGQGPLPPGPGRGGGGLPPGHGAAVQRPVTG